MKTKSFLLFMGLILCASVSYAQITTGKPSAREIRTGNRPQAGSFGLYFGASTSMFKDVFDSDIKVKAMPLINLKYLTSDQFEVRLGFQYYDTTEKLKGDIHQPEEGIQADPTSVMSKYGRSEAMFYPGIAYHFSKKNLLDVYVGAEIPIGWNAEKNKSEQNDDTYSVTKSSGVVGIGAFVGLQAFIANLPLAVGLEYGISSRFDLGLKYKNETSGNGNTQTFYTSDDSQFMQLNGSDARFNKLKARKGTIGNQLRITLTYYFK